MGKAHVWLLKQVSCEGHETSYVPEMWKLAFGFRVGRKGSKDQLVFGIFCFELRAIILSSEN